MPRTWRPECKQGQRTTSTVCMSMRRLLRRKKAKRENEMWEQWGRDLFLRSQNGGIGRWMRDEGWSGERGGGGDQHNDLFLPFSSSFCRMQIWMEWRRRKKKWIGGRLSCCVCVLFRMGKWRGQKLWGDVSDGWRGKGWFFVPFFLGSPAGTIGGGGGGRTDRS